MSLQKNSAEKNPENKRPPRCCCACKKVRKIVNVGGPPLCETCYPLACNWGKALEQHMKFEMSIAGITPEIIDIGRDDDDLSYFLEEVSKYHAEAKMKLKQADICLINICTMLRNEKSHDKPGVDAAEVETKKTGGDWEPINRRKK